MKKKFNKTLFALSMLLVFATGIIVSPQITNAANWVVTAKERISKLVVIKSINLKGYIKNSKGAVKIKDNLKVTGNINMNEDKTVDGADISDLSTTVTNLSVGQVSLNIESGSGLALEGNTLSLLNTCTANQILKYNADNSSWECATDYVSVENSDMTIGNGLTLDDDNILSVSGVTSAMINDGTINTADLADASITATKLASNSCTSNQMLKYNGTAWACSNTGDDYKNIINVAKTGGDYSTIADALNSITDNSATNTYLINIGPGTYEEQVTMKNYVNLNGSGNSLTIIESHGGGNMTTNSTVLTADNSFIHNLAIVMEGTSVNGSAVYINGAGSQLENLIIAAYSATNENIGINIDGNAMPYLNNLTIVATGGVDATGIDIADTAEPDIYRCQVAAQSASWINYGIRAGGTGEFSINDTDIIATASGAAATSGLFNIGNTITFTNVSVSASGGATDNTGVYNSSSSILYIHRSNIIGTNKSIHNYGTVKLGATEISAAVTNVNAGSSVCAQVYNSSFAEAGAGCTFL